MDAKEHEYVFGLKWQLNFNRLDWLGTSQALRDSPTDSYVVLMYATHVQDTLSARPHDGKALRVSEFVSGVSTLTDNIYNMSAIA